MKHTLVMKFGGTSVGSADALTKATQIVKDAYAQTSRVVVVTSAMSGVTNLLLECSAQAAQSNIDNLPEAEKTIREKHFAAADTLIADEEKRAAVKKEIDALIQSLTNLCKAIAVLGEASPRVLDAISAIGERMSVRLLGAVLESAGLQAKALDATEFVVQ